MPNIGAMEKPDWRIISSSYVVDTRHLTLRKDTIALPNGGRIEDYYVRESRGYIIVFALTPDGRIILVRQYKHGIGKVLLELPAGAIDPGERPLQTAVREFTEETGYAGELQYVRTFVTDPTNADTVAHLFFAPHARRVSEQQLDISENIVVEFATIEEVRSFVRDGTIDSAPHVASIYLMLDQFQLSS